MIDARQVEIGTSGSLLGKRILLSRKDRGLCNFSLILCRQLIRPPNDLRHSSKEYAEHFLTIWHIVKKLSEMVSQIKELFYSTS